MPGLHVPAIYPRHRQQHGIQQSLLFGLPWIQGGEGVGQTSEFGPRSASAASRARRALVWPARCSSIAACRRSSVVTWPAKGRAGRGLPWSRRRRRGGSGGSGKQVELRRFVVVALDRGGDRGGVGFAEKLVRALGDGEQAHGAFVGRDDAAFPGVEVNAERLREPADDIEGEGVEAGRSRRRDRRLRRANPDRRYRTELVWLSGTPAARSRGKGRSGGHPLPAASRM